MNEVSQLIFDTLTQNVAFTTEMSNRLFPLFAIEGTDYPFSVYYIGEISPLSYESRSFPVTVSLCYAPENYIESITFADVVKGIFETVPDCNYESTVTSFDEDNKSIIVNINLIITK